MILEHAMRNICFHLTPACTLQAVGPVAVTSLILGSNIKDVIDAPIQTQPNNPHNAVAQQEYNTACTQVSCHQDDLNGFVCMHHAHEEMVYQPGWPPCGCQCSESPSVVIPASARMYLAELRHRVGGAGAVCMSWHGM